MRQRPRGKQHAGITALFAEHRMTSKWIGESCGKEMNLVRNQIVLALAALVLLLPAPGFAQKQDSPPKPKPDAAKSEASSSEKGLSEKGSAGKPDKLSGFSILHIEVTAGEKDQGVDNASVYVRFPEARILGREKLVEMNVKTNREGTVKVPNVPRGKALIQVIASGWKTFGRWFDLSKDEETIKIKLEKPPRWY
jgi:hypothetical protein